jgi:hypothetical protein
MTTPSSKLLSDYNVSAPVRVIRQDSTSYICEDQTMIDQMIIANVVEGVGPPSGRIEKLRMIVAEGEAVKLIAAIERPAALPESPGSITSQASRTVYREKVNDCLWCWAFMPQPQRA